MEEENMKKIIIAILVFLVLSTSVFSAEKANESATLVLNLDAEEFLVGFSSTAGTITKFENNIITLNEEVNASTLDTFSLSFGGPVYLYYKVVTASTANYKIQLAINEPLKSSSIENTYTMPYSLKVNAVGGRWDGTGASNVTVSSPTTIDEASKKYNASSEDIGNIRDTNTSSNYLVRGFAELTIVSEGNPTNIPLDTYQSTIKVSIVTE